MSAATPARSARLWAAGTSITPAPPCLTEFEELVRAVGLEACPQLWLDNARLRKFAKRFKNSRYVPEEFLKAIGTYVEDEF